MQNITIENIICRAASPWERFPEYGFTPAPEQDDDIISARRADWLAVSGLSMEEFKQYLHEFGENYDRFLTATQNMVIDDAKKLPQWAQILIEMDKELQDSKPNAEFSNIHYIVRFLVNKTQLQLNALAVKNGLTIHTEYGCNPGLLEYAIHRIRFILNNILTTEARLKNIPINDITQCGGNDWNEWKTRLNQHAGMARSLAMVMVNFHNTILESFGYLMNDWEQICTRYFAGQRPTTILNMACGQGDHHANGRSVIIYNTNLGKIISKPKKLDLSLATINYMEEVFTAIMGPGNYKKAELWVLQNHSYENFITHIPTESTAGFKRFYQRLGVWLAGLQMTGASDFWLDNLIAHGEFPVFIDFETAIQQGTDMNEQLFDEKYHQLGGQVSDWVLSVGITPLILGLKGVARDLCCLKAVENGQENAKLMGISIFGDNIYLPKLADGTIANPSDYLEDFLEYYQKSMQFFMGPDGKKIIHQYIQNIHGMKSRYILINTFTGYDGNHIAVKYGLCSDGIRQYMNIEKFWRERVEINHSKPVKIWRDIFDDMIMHDIPLFFSYTNNRDLSTANGTNIANFVGKTAAEIITQRVKILSPAVVGEHIKFVQTIVAGLENSPIRPTAITGQAQPQHQPAFYQKIIADILVNKYENAPAQFVVDPLPMTEIVTIMPLSNSAFNGKLTIANILLDYGQNAQNAYYTNIAHKIIQDIKAGPIDTMKLYDSYLFMGAYYGGVANEMSLMQTCKTYNIEYNNARLNEYLQKIADLITTYQNKRIEYTDYTLGQIGFIEILCILQQMGVNNPNIDKILTILYELHRPITQYFAIRHPNTKFAQIWFHRHPSVLFKYYQYNRQYGVDILENTPAYSIETNNIWAYIGDIIAGLRENPNNQYWQDHANIILQNAHNHPLHGQYMAEMDLLHIHHYLGNKAQKQAILNQFMLQYDQYGRFFAQSYIADDYNLNINDGLGALYYFFK